MVMEDVAQGLASLARRGISRRSFLKLCSATALAMGLDLKAGRRMARAAAAAISKKPVVWMQGQGCTGCSESLLSSLDPDPAAIVLDLLSVRYHPTIMAGAGKVAQRAWEETVRQGGYILVLEGAIPLADPRFCLVEGRPFSELFIEAAQKAEVVVAAGSCASYGGIPAAGPTRAAGAQAVVKDKPVINVPSCPVKPNRLLGTLLYYLSFGEAPPLDNFGRPIPYYQRFLQHDSCPRRAHYEKGEFLKDWNDPKTVDWCLLYKGCKGPLTYTDCPRIWWNDGVNYCIRAGSPCSGCTQPEFYAKLSPLYAKQEIIPEPSVFGLSMTTAAKGITGLAAVGVAAHATARFIAGRQQEGKEDKK